MVIVNSKVNSEARWLCCYTHTFISNFHFLAKIYLLNNS